MSQHGLLTTVAYQLGQNKPVTFALKGAVSMAGQSVRWLRDNLDFFKEAKDVGKNESFQNVAQKDSRAKCFVAKRFLPYPLPFLFCDTLLLSPSPTVGISSAQTTPSQYTSSVCNCCREDIQTILRTLYCNVL